VIGGEIAKLAGQKGMTLDENKKLVLDHYELCTGTTPKL
jgi:hypothetical protein